MEGTNVQAAMGGSIWTRKLLQGERRKESVRKLLVALTGAILTFFGWGIYFLLSKMAGPLLPDIALPDWQSLKIHGFWSHEWIIISIPFVLSLVISGFFLMIYFLPYWFLVRGEYRKSMKTFGQSILICFFGTLFTLLAPGILTPVSLTCESDDPFDSCSPIKAWFDSEKRLFKGRSEAEMGEFYPFRRIGSFYVQKGYFSVCSDNELNFVYGQVVKVLKESGNYQWLEKAGVKIALTKGGNSYFEDGRNLMTINVFFHRLPKNQCQWNTGPSDDAGLKGLRVSTLHETGHAYFYHYLCPEAKAKGMIKECAFVSQGQLNLSYLVATELYAPRFQKADGKPFCTLEECAWLFKPIEELTKGDSDLAKEAQADKERYERQWQKQNLRYYFRKATHWELVVLAKLGFEGQVEPANDYDDYYG
jgi:hypothetical protein